MLAALFVASCGVVPARVASERLDTWRCGDVETPACQRATAGPAIGRVLGSHAFGLRIYMARRMYEEERCRRGKSRVLPPCGCSAFLYPTLRSEEVREVISAVKEFVVNAHGILEARC